jgi:CheY-like chemotaxis protein
LILAEVEEKVAATGLHGKHLLLAEDNEINQQVAKELLGSVGIEVTVVDNGRQAIAALEQNEFDVVLMDIQMPVMDGYLATQQIRKQARFANLPIIAMTANALAGDRDAALEAGMNDYVTKPIEPKKLFETLSRWFRASKTPKPAFSPVAQEDPPAISLPGISTNDALKRLGGNTALFLRLLTRFAKSNRNTSEQIESELAQGNVAEVKRLVHTLKGVAGNLGAMDLHGEAISLEQALRGDSPATVPLEGFRQALTLVLDGISSLQTESTLKPEPLVDKDKWQTIWQELVTLLEDRDMEVVQAVEQLQATSPFEELEQIRLLLEKYDFEASLDLARVAIAKLSNGRTS